VKISPLDIKKQEFAKKFRGYSPDEVHSYLEMVAVEYEDMIRKSRDLEQKVGMLEERLDHYKRMENVLQETLITTQRAAEETKAAAEKRAQTIISEAKMEAQRIANENNEKLGKVRRDIADLTNQRDSFAVSFRSLLESQISLLNILEKKGTTREEVVPARRKADLSDEELDNIVNEFERKIGLAEDDPDNGGKGRIRQ
jgi:cell division initiation protein